MCLSVEQVSEIVKMLGLVSGGLWAAWTFHKLQKVRAAEIDNNQKLSQIQKASIEQEEIRTRLLRQQPQLAIHIKAVEMAPVTEGGKTLFCITVTLKNEGEQNLKVDFDRSALTVGRIGFTKTGEQEIQTVHRFRPSYFAAETDDPQEFTYRIFRAGQARQMALAAVPVIEPAAYMIQFHARYGRMPFDGDTSSGEEHLLIDAIEQTFFLATGKPSEFRGDA